MNRTNSIPFLDLVSPHAELKEELCAVFASALDTAGFIGGPMVQGFEAEFASFCETKHCVGVGSGTDAVRFALMAAGVQHGDAVVTVPNTFIATTEAISQAGARPVFVDIDERTYNMDPAKLGKYLETGCSVDSVTGRLIDGETKCPVTAIVPVHLYGQMADMDSILLLARKYNLVVVEDACQAHGAQYFSQAENRWCKAGSMGTAAAFSFYPGKNLGACGEAGAITTNDETLARKARVIRDHGQAKKYYHDMEGYNGRLDAIQAGILGIKLKHLANWNARRREAAQRYNELFAGQSAAVVVPYEASWSKAVYHLYVVRCANRDGLREALGKQGIDSGIHYPIPLHLQKAYSGAGYERGDFPVCEAVAEEIISLPMFPTLDVKQQRRVVELIESYTFEHEGRMPVGTSGL